MITIEIIDIYIVDIDIYYFYGDNARDVGQVFGEKIHICLYLIGSHVVLHEI